jgi:3-hydroxyisobutyrate dehydrogenase-like beta-hydroxyacid dehydrogenase
MQPVEERVLAEADFLMSIVPPGDAPTLAKRLAPLLTAANKKPIYVECNAVSPPTMLKIADEVSGTGCAFIGAGIIGPPPKPGSTNTRIYASGPHAGELATLNDYGLIVRVLSGPLTAASALKMSYAGITKGFTALGAAMMLAAKSKGRAVVIGGGLLGVALSLILVMRSSGGTDLGSVSEQWMAQHRAGRADDPQR